MILHKLSLNSSPAADFQCSSQVSKLSLPVLTSVSRWCHNSSKNPQHNSKTKLKTAIIFQCEA